jgi:hypothetical protein
MKRALGITIAFALAACNEAAPNDDGGTGPADVPGLDAPGADVPGPDAPLPDGDLIDAPRPSCGLPVAFDVGIAPTRTLHVAPGGSGDGSEGAPFGDIEAAVRAASPGTEVRIHAGTYDGGLYLEDVHGTAAAPIWLRGDEGAIIDAGGEGEVLHVTEASYFVIEGIEMRNGAVNGLNIDDGGSAETPTHHIVLRDLHVHDVGTGGNNDCIKLSGIDDYFVLGSTIERCDAGDGIDHVGCHRGFLHGNTFAGLSGGGIQMKGGSADIHVHGNRFSDVAGRGINAGGSTGLEFFRPIDAPYEAARLLIEANVFERIGEASGAPIAFVGCDGCVFIHNTIIDPQTWVARILQESTDARFVPSRNGVFANNIVVFDAADLRSFVNVGAGTAPETFTFANDLWFARDDPSFDGPLLGDGIPAETGSVIQMDPMLITPDVGSFPCWGGPAFRAGTPRGEATADYDGSCWDAEMPDIGAFRAASCTD